MMKLYKKNVVFALLLVAILLPLNTGCGMIFRRPNEKQSKQTQEQKKSPPKTLTSLENITEGMIKDIQEVEDKRNKAVQQKQEGPKEEQAHQQEEEKPKEEDQPKEEKSGEGEQKDKKEDQKKQEKPNEKQAKSATIDWNKMQKDVEKLQSSWSNYVNVATNDGASNDLIKNYETQLDILTTKVMERQEESLLDAANDLYRYYPKFFDLYKHQAPPNVKDMKYYIRKIIIDSEKEQWSQNKDSIDSIKQAWETAKSRMEKPDRDMNRKIEAAIDSFTRSVQQQNKHLIKMKGNILIKNLEEIK